MAEKIDQLCLKIVQPVSIGSTKRAETSRRSTRSGNKWWDEREERIRQYAERANQNAQLFDQ